MRLMGVLPAADVLAGDQLVASITGSPIIPVDVTQVFNTGHGRVQISIQDFGHGWFEADQLVCVLREISL